MKRLIIASTIVAAVTAGSGASAFVDHQICVGNDDGAWTCSTSFAYAGSCGSHCTMSLAAGCPGVGIDWVSYTGRAYGDLDMFDAWYYDSDDGAWHTTCDYEGPVPGPDDYEYYYGMNEDEGLDDDSFEPWGVAVDYSYDGDDTVYRHLIGVVPSIL